MLIELILFPFTWIHLIEPEIVQRESAVSEFNPLADPVGRGDAAVAGGI